MKQTAYSNGFKIGFVKAYKSSGVKAISKFLQRSQGYKDLMPNTAQKCLMQLNVYSSTLRSEHLQKANAQTQSSVYNYFNTCNDD